MRDDKKKFQETFEYSSVSVCHEKAAQVNDREKIALDTLARYTGSEPEDFQKFILLTNFPYYVELFAKKMEIEIVQGSVLKVAHDKKNNISIIDYRVGAPMAALITDVLSYTKPQAIIMLGLCGGLYPHHSVGDLFIPMAAIRGEGVSDQYMPKEVPSLPALMVQQYVSQTLMNNNREFYTGVLHSTNYRMWEFDEEFKQKLVKERATAIDMECSALFTVGFARKVPMGALMLISDLPLEKTGIKTKDLARKVFKNYTDEHLDLGVKTLLLLQKIAKERKVDFRQFHFS